MDDDDDDDADSDDSDDDVDWIWLLIQSRGKDTNQPIAPAKPPIYSNRSIVIILSYMMISNMILM